MVSGHMACMTCKLINRTLKVNSVEATMALLEKSSEGRVTAATAMNKVKMFI